jgi:hypothetical protein
MNKKGRKRIAYGLSVHNQNVSRYKGLLSATHNGGFIYASRRLSNLNRPTGLSYKVVLVCRLSIEFVCRLPRRPADRCNKNQPHHTDMEPFGLHILAPRRLYPPQAD